MKFGRIVQDLVKIFLVFGLLVLTYSGYMKYSEYRIQGQVNQLRDLTRLRMNLVQSRASWIALARLDPGSSDVIRQKTVLISQISKSIDEGKKLIDSGEIYNRQQEVLDELFTKKTFDEGIEYLRSERVVQLLTDMTNLILEYEYREGRIREQLKPNR